MLTLIERMTKKQAFLNAAKFMRKKDQLLTSWRVHDPAARCVLGLLDAQH